MTKANHSTGARQLHRLPANILKISRPGRSYGDGGGLRLIKSATGAAKWVFRYSFHGRVREAGLGSARNFSLAEARDRAAGARDLLARGIDPMELPTAKETSTFEKCAIALIASKSPAWRNPKHVKLRSGENPAAWRGHLKHVLPAPKKLTRGHHAAMPYAEVPDFMARLREQDGMAALALRFVILTAARSGEVLGSRWDEIDFSAKVWTVPASRMKGGREHRVALSARARSSKSSATPRGAITFFRALAVESRCLLGRWPK